MRQRFIASLVLTGICALATTSHATFIGDQVVLSGSTAFSGSEILTVANGVDTTIVDGRISVDIGIDTIDLFATPGFAGTLFEPGDFLLIADLNDLGSASSIIGASFSEIGIAGSNLITFGADWVNIDFNSSLWNANFAHLTIELETSTVVTIAEPAVLMLLGLGLAAMGVARRKHR